MIAAIIVEYNPIHNGHLYHIKCTREMLDKVYPNTENHIIAIMSGGFCQRGEPAILNKYTRSKHALLNGVDMVLELPSIYATSSAEYFAKGAIEIISKISDVGLICFGSESGDISSLTSICDIMQSTEYNFLIKANLESGLSYPISSSKALSELGVTDESMLTSPNNTLAIEYIKQSRKYNNTATLATISRQGGGYHDSNIHDLYSSATAIRNSLSNKTIQNMQLQMPEVAYNDIANASIDYNKLFGVISSNALTISKVYEDNEGVINRIKRGIETANSYDELVEYSHTKRYTKSKIKRILIHIALNHIDIDTSRSIGAVKVLGVRENCKKLLSNIDHTGDSFHFDMDAKSNSIYNIVSTDKITMDKMLIIE